MIGRASSPGSVYVLSETTEYEDSSLDPRIHKELEKLNKASEEINCLEIELDNSRSTFRQILNESTIQLNSLAKKLGTCVDKARPYYDARKKALEAQLCTQNAAMKFEKACSQLTAAKEMVNLAEQGYFKMGQAFDPAWQEMLNHSTIKVNEAEKERLECEVAHKMTTFISNEAEQTVRRLQKEFKRSIAKSKPYFEMKAKYNHMMEDQKKKVQHIEMSVSEAKAFYSETLRTLERISDEIHAKRGTQTKKRKGRRTIIRPKKPDQIYHPLMDSNDVIIEEVSSPSPDDNTNTFVAVSSGEVESKSQVPPKSVVCGSASFDGLSRSVGNEVTSDVSNETSRQLCRSLTEHEVTKTDGNIQFKTIFIPSSTSDIHAETVFHAPLNPVKVENLSVDRVSESLIVHDQMINASDLTPVVEAKTIPSDESGIMSNDSLKETMNGKMSSKENSKILYNSVSFKRSEQIHKEPSSHIEKSSQFQEAMTTSSEGLETKVLRRRIQNDTQQVQQDPHQHLQQVTFPEKVVSESERSCVEQQFPCQMTNVSDTHFTGAKLCDHKPGSERLILRTSNLPSSSAEMSEQKTESAFLLRFIGQQKEQLGKFSQHLKQQLSNFQGQPVVQQPSGSTQPNKQTATVLQQLEQQQLQVTIPDHPLTSSSFPLHWIHLHHLQMSSEAFSTASSPMHSNRLSPPLLLQPQNKQDLTCCDANSETESVASSLNSTSLLDDEQIESLMMETSQYHRFLSQMDSQETEHFRGLTLPHKLRYLKNFVNFEPIWLDGCADDDEISDEDDERDPESRHDQVAMVARVPLEEQNICCRNGNDDYEGDGEDEECKAIRRITSSRHAVVICQSNEMISGGEMDKNVVSPSYGTSEEDAEVESIVYNGRIYECGGNDESLRQTAPKRFNPKKLTSMLVDQLERKFL